MLFLKYHLKFPLVLCAMLSCVRLFVTPWMQASHLNLLCPWDSSGKNAGVGCHFFFQGIFLSQGLNSCLLFAGRFFTTEPLGKPISTY